jgi:hypothetical protein
LVKWLWRTPDGQGRQPSANGALNPGAEVPAAAARREELSVDALNEDAAILHRFDIVRDLDELARGDVGVGEGGEAWRSSTR